MNEDFPGFGFKFLWALCNEAKHSLNNSQRYMKLIKETLTIINETDLSDFIISY